MHVPEQAGQLGGLFTCPRCRVVTSLAPVAAAHPPDGRVQRPSDRAGRAIVLVFGIIFGSVLLANIAPVIAIVVGVGCAALSAAYLLKQSARERFDRVFGLASTGPRKKMGTALLAGFWSIFMLIPYGTWIATGGPGRARTERAAQQSAQIAAVREADEQKLRAAEAERRRQADIKLNEAEALLGVGQIEQARRAADEAQALEPSDARAAQLIARADESGRQQALATMPARHAAIADKAQRNAWREAAGLCAEARAIDPENAQIKSACGEVDTEIRRLDTVAWVEAATRAAAEQCDTPAAIGDAWRNLKQIRPEEGEYKNAKKAAAKLEKCRKTAEKTLSEALRAVMIKQRTDWADSYETLLLDQSIDASVTLHGKYKDSAKIRWVLLGRAMVHQITKDGEFLAHLQKIGFKRVTFSDGYFESWYYDLKPESEENRGKDALKGVGLSQPIAM